MIKENENSQDVVLDKFNNRQNSDVKTIVILLLVLSLLIIVIFTLLIEKNLKAIGWRS